MTTTPPNFPADPSPVRQTSNADPAAPHPGSVTEGLTSIATFTVPYRQYLNAQHDAVRPFPDWATPEQLLEFYRIMTLIRTFDRKAVNLQRTGKMGTYPSSLGQEAIGTGMGYALMPDDLYFPHYRDQCAMYQRGVSLEEMLMAWGGDERGNAFKAEPAASHDFPLCIPIAGQCLHAVGAAYALQYHQHAQAVLVCVGDGGTSKADFYEAINLAGAWKLPIVFVVNNNQYAISLPVNEQTACQTLAQKAIAGGFSSEQIDGNDVIAVADAVSLALANARQGGGPHLIETVSYRLADHTTADDATRYREHAELQAAWAKEPIARLAYYMEAQGYWSKEKEAELHKQCQAEVDAAAHRFVNRPPQDPSTCFDYLYAELPDALWDQREMFLAYATQREH